VAAATACDATFPHLSGSDPRSGVQDRIADASDKGQATDPDLNFSGNPHVLTYEVEKHTSRKRNAN
jgi:hypothetical protein